MQPFAAGPVRLVACTALFLAARPALAATLYVPHQYPDVGAAYQAAKDGDRLLLDSGAYQVNLYLDKNITIEGAGPTRTVLTAGKGSPTVAVPLGKSATLRGLTVADGHSDAAGYGGSVYNAGTLTMERCTIAHGLADKGGGGLANLGGSVSLTDCIVSGGNAPAGGGIYNAGQMTLNRCTLMENSAANGGGVFNTQSLTMRSSTVSDNTAAGVGGGIAQSDGTAVLNNVTITANTATTGGGFHATARFFPTNTIVAGNQAGTGPDGSGPVSVAAGQVTTFNFFGSTSGMTGSTVGGGTIRNADPRLGPLSFHSEPRARFGDTLAGGVTGIPDSVFLGAPDESYLGLGSDAVVYDFGANVILNEAGPDLNVYEVDFGVAEFGSVDVLVSLDGVHFQSVKSSEGALFRIPGDTAHGAAAFSRSYDIAAARLPYVRYVKVQGTGAGGAGGSTGFDLDAVGAIHTPTLPLQTPTHTLQAGSPAIDAGATNGVEVTDQTGVMRHQDGDGDNIVEGDMGAVEVRKVYVVTTTADSGLGSLRAAIESNNLLGIGDARITFNIPGPGPFVIRPAALLDIRNPVFIDGFSQPGYSGRPLIELDGSASTGSGGLAISSYGCVVRGLSIHGFQGDSHYGVVVGYGRELERRRTWVYANTIGVRPDGRTTDPNEDGLVLLAEDACAGSNLDGVNDDAEGNVISGNHRFGVSISASHTIIAGNRIGTDAAGAAAVPNGNAGVWVAFGTGNTVRRNSIAFNSGLGIDLGGLGLTPNDRMDPDTGANGLQNAPNLGDLRLSEQVRVTGSLDGVPNTVYLIDLYESMREDPSGYGEGQRYLGSTRLTTAPDGYGSFDVTLPHPALGSWITATATDPDGSTSEFSGGGRPPYTMADAARILAVAGGLREGTPFDANRVVVPVRAITVNSAVRVAREVAGTN